MLSPWQSETDASRLMVARGSPGTSKEEQHFSPLLIAQGWEFGQGIMADNRNEVRERERDQKWYLPNPTSLLKPGPTVVPKMDTGLPMELTPEIKIDTTRARRMRLTESCIFFLGFQIFGWEIWSSSLLERNNSENIEHCGSNRGQPTAAEWNPVGFFGKHARKIVWELFKSNLKLPYYRSRLQSRGNLSSSLKRIARCTLR